MSTTGFLSCQPEPAPGERAGVVASVHDHLTVDDHGRDSDRIAVRIVVGRQIADPRGVENHHVRPRALAEHAAVREPERGGGGTGGLVNGRGQREYAEVADEMAEQAGVRPVRARVRLASLIDLINIRVSP